MTAPDASLIKAELAREGIEIYRTRGQEVAIAERVRMHLMDSGIRVCGVDSERAQIRFVARAQRSDVPSRSETDSFALVRNSVGGPASARGYREARSDTVEVADPHDQTRVLDVWYEVEYERDCATIEECIEEVKWALSIERYVI